LRAIGVEGDFLDIMDKMDKGAIVLVFGLFLLGLVRRALSALFAEKNADVC
jgi:hypothetical protein